MILIKSIKIKNMLSFGPDSPDIELKDLNVLIGPNGSGKSNFISVFDILRHANGDIFKPMKYGGGGVHEWLWKGSDEESNASIELILDEPHSNTRFEYYVKFAEESRRPRILEEKIRSLDDQYRNVPTPRLLYEYNGSKARLDAHGEQIIFESNDLHPEKSILNQVRDPVRYFEITYLGDTFKEIGFYRYWTLGPKSPIRNLQKADLPSKYLMEDLSNLGLVLNNLSVNPKVKKSIIHYLSEFHEKYNDFNIHVSTGTVELFLTEGEMIVPITRLSDGTLRYLCLLAILLDPDPPPLICIEEPELGLHPDILPTMAKLLLEASQRTQIILTTHSDILVDALHDYPETVVVCEKENLSTVMRRLDREELATWRQDYSLGHLWRSGEIGGNRW